MQNDFDYNEVPYKFLHCVYRECIHAGECLRYQIMHRLTPLYPVLSVINPKRIPDNGKDCPYFFADRKLRFARGITHLLDHLPHNKYKKIKKQILEYFGRNTYYRIRNKERLVSPSEQSFIREIFRENGIMEEPLFDEFVERYEWLV